MPVVEFSKYWQAITPLEAQDALMQMQIADYPHIGKDGRKQLYKQLHKMAYKHKPKSELPIVSLEELAAHF